MYFVSQVKPKNSIYYASSGDFLVNEKYIFEIGGKNKGFKQVKDIDNSFVASDGIEAGYGNLVKQRGREAMTLCEKIPLWLFGFLY